MSVWNIIPEDWFNRFTRGTRGRRGEWGSQAGDVFRSLDEMRREMETVFEDQLQDIQSKAPKELVREYQTPDGTKVREVGPLVYGYSVTIGPDGKPQLREFGNVRVPGISGKGYTTRPQITAEREPLADITTTDKEIKVIVEIPGVKKENIKINAYDNSVEITTNDPERKYHQTIDLPPEANIETAKSTYNNGILEVTFKKKQQTAPKGKEIKVE
jgi:HSP20 family protein